MTQNRKPPAYQEYAATILADKHFRLMSLSERGLYYSLKLECWQNGNVPADFTDLAKYLGYEAREITENLSDKVKVFFELDNSSLTCPEIEDYRQHLNEQRKKQSEGGKKGAEKVNAMRQQPASNSRVSRRVTRESLVKSSTEKHSQEKSSDKDDSLTNDVWLNEYDRASNGS